jgi:hypothetical protein
MSGVVPLLPPSLLTLHAARLASSTLARSRVGTMRWHACVCRVATSIHPLSSSPPLQRRMDKRPPRRLHARLLPLRRRCCPHEHACSTAAPSRHFPLSLLAQARIAPMQCATIKGTSPVHFVCASGFTVHRFWST